MASEAYILTAEDLRTLRELIATVDGQKNFGGGSLFGGRSVSRGRQPPAEGMRIGKVAGRSAAEGTTDTVVYDIQTFNGGSMAPFGVGLAPWLRAVPASDTETVLAAAEVGALCVYWVGEMVETPDVGREVHLICVQGEGLAVGDCAGARSAPGGGGAAALVADLAQRVEVMERRLVDASNQARALLLADGGG